MTVNVLIKEAELGMLVDMLASLEALEVDAIIVQVHIHTTPHRGHEGLEGRGWGSGVCRNAWSVDDVCIRIGFSVPGRPCFE